MEPEKKMNGAMVGLVIIVLILVVGGIYIWREYMKQVPAPATGEETLSEEDALTEEELNQLETDVNSADTEVEADVNALE